SGCGHVNDNLVELLILIQACRMGSAKKISVVLPLFPYSRQSDRLQKKRLIAIDQAGPRLQHDTSSESNNSNSNGNSLSGRSTSTAQLNGVFGQLSVQDKDEWADACARALLDEGKDPDHIVNSINFHTTASPHENRYKQWCARPGTLVARLIQEAGANHLITMDLHHPQYQSFFDIPLDQIYAEPCIIRFIRSEIPVWRSAVIVSPDAGGAKRATSIANQLGLEFALIHRESRSNHSECTGLVGEVNNRPVIIIDDMIDTAETVSIATRILKHHGATKIYVIATHGIFSNRALETINSSPIEMVACTNTVPQAEFRAMCPILHTIDISGILAEAIRRTFFGESLSNLFVHEKLF
ncbi:ribose-phosphate pyrophosphokinase, partial [Spiromyces aspiralis]